MDLVEFDGAAGGGEVAEHATPTHGGELPRVPHHDHAPLVVVGETGQLGEVGGGEGAGLVDDHRRPHPQPVSLVGWPVGSVCS